MRHLLKILRAKRFIYLNLVLLLLLSWQPSLMGQNSAGRLAATDAFSDSTLDDNDPIVTLSVLDKIAVSAPVDGFIQKIVPRLGDEVKQNAIIVAMDRQEIDSRLKIVGNEFEALKIRSTDRSREISSKARQRAAQVNVSSLQEVVELHQLRISDLEAAQAKATLDQATAESEGAIKEVQQFRFEALAKQSELELLKADWKNSIIPSRYDGSVARIMLNEGEYARKGDPILEVHRLDKLLGVLLIDHEQMPPQNAIGRQITVRFSDAVAELQGRTWVARVRRTFPQIDVDGRYRVFVELQNERGDSGRWLLIPGMTGNATVSKVQDNEVPLPKKFAIRPFDNTAN